MKRFWILVILAFSFTPPASATSWQQAIRSVEQRSEELWALARRRGLEGSHLGSLYNELHVLEHKCSILGRMLGREDLIAEIERSTEMDLSYADGHTTGLAAHSLNNWVYIAEGMLELSNENRIRRWNLDCAGSLGIPAAAYIPEERSDIFYSVNRNILHVLGDVQPGFSEELKNAIQRNPQVDTVALGSGGGSVHEALLAGYFIRSLGLKTTVWNNCYSACTIVFIGGVSRDIMSPYPKLSFHQISQNGRAVPLDDHSYQDVFLYAARMGVDPRAFIELMHSAGPAAFTTPHPQYLCNVGIATWVQRICP